MNRNKKHPERAAHRRRAKATDRTKNTNGYRITGSWDDRPDRPAVKPTSDRKAARRIARSMADQGAYVIVEEHHGYGRWSTWFEVDGPAQLAAALAAEAEARARAEAQRRAAEQAADARRAAAEKSERDLDALARMMVRPPVAREQCGRRDARHVTGAQR
ncbi:hypothetical protein SEA_RALEIGH_41 [Streptomyces phage Raleigh]|uniref:Uncharacterized protein n=1 Tax=Streptomyces phage Raleigh TaxID=1920312 RepID=A0A1J0MCR5_9CAUD|nr:hypothetical protein [Streptomyces sp. MMBL 11-1]YP_009788300.1 hypothetical protein HOR46_gp41 [Streptomyces phage Raleigh]APD18789.1 hypothetical protein SEA_RALEIGH_41 [Streptomyces phage Raleigh]